MDKKTLEEFRELLLSERGRLQALVGDKQDDVKVDTTEESASASGAAGSPADVATDVYDREQALSLARDFQARIDEINHALEKIDDGTYGVSEVSGEPIPLERLRVVPWARRTIEEEREYEEQLS
jgi:RNA polymerase-binding transcription factor DksA